MSSTHFFGYISYNEKSFCELDSGDLERQQDERFRSVRSPEEVQDNVGRHNRR